jgi:hypothetical protein
MVLYGSLLKMSAQGNLLLMQMIVSLVHVKTVVF